MAKRPVRRVPASTEPSNLSRGAGASAPASAAATAPFVPPVAPTSGLTSAGGFYTPDPPAEPAQRVEVKDTFVDATRAQAIEAHDTHFSADPAIAAADQTTVERGEETIEQAIARIEAMRIPLGAFSQKLALDKRPGYKRHWFNDSPGRIDEALANGWAHVKDKDGTPKKRVVGTGRDNNQQIGYAMEIPEIFWLRDQEARNEAAAEKLNSLKAAPFKSQPGAAKPSDRGKFYDPQESGEGPLSIKTY